TAWRMRPRKSSQIDCGTANRPGISGGYHPADPTAFGIIAPGTNSILAGFKTPSSSACQIPVTAIDAFFRINSTTLFAVLISGNAFITGDRPYTSPGALAQRKAMKGDTGKAASASTAPSPSSLKMTA